MARSCDAPVRTSFANVVWGTDGNDAAIARERNAAAAAVGGALSIDIAPELTPGAAIPLVDARVAGPCAIAIVLGGTDGNDAAVA